MVLRLVAENEKKRFEVVWGYDPSPPKSKSKGPGKGKGKGKGKTENKVDVETLQQREGDVVEGDSNDVEDTEYEPATVNDTALTVEPMQADLPLVMLPQGIVEDEKGEWWIRATQGHSIQLESTSHLEEVKNDEDGRARVGLMVHGTKWELWDILSQ
jgi:2'-phosphotransferase